MAAGERFEGIVDLVFVAGADLPVVHDGGESVACFLSVLRDVGLANSEEMGTEAADQPLQKDLKDGCCDERVQ